MTWDLDTCAMQLIICKYLTPGSSGLIAALSLFLRFADMIPAPASPNIDNDKNKCARILC